MFSCGQKEKSCSDSERLSDNQGCIISNEISVDKEQVEIVMNVATEEFIRHYPQAKNVEFVNLRLRVNPIVDGENNRQPKGQEMECFWMIFPINYCLVDSSYLNGLMDDWSTGKIDQYGHPTEE